MTDHLQRVDEQAGRADEHYKKLCRLEQLCREKARLLHDCSPRNASGLLIELLKEAGLE